MYITQDEFALLQQLDGASLTKTRWTWPTGGRTLVVDEIKGTLDGLILAEVELGGDEEFLPTPRHAVADVTSEDRYSGASLAHLTLDGATALLAEVVELVRRGGRP
jgi:CYTH domain-containing protein